MLLALNASIVAYLIADHTFEKKYDNNEVVFAKSLNDLFRCNFFFYKFYI